MQKNLIEKINSIENNLNGDSNYTKYGHAKAGGSINILEFEVDTNKYNSSGNPTTDKWNLEWDSSSGVNKIDNYGTII